MFCPSTSKEYFGHGYIKLSVIIGGKRSVFSTGVFCRRDHWQPGKLYGVKDGPKVKEHNRLLSAIMQQAEEIRKRMRTRRIEPVAAKVVAVLKYLEKTKPPVGVESLFYTELTDEDFDLALNLTTRKVSPPLMPIIRQLKEYKDLDKTTLKRYESTENCLEDYLKHIKRPNMTADEFTEAEAHKMCDWLRLHRERKLSRVTICRYMGLYVNALKEARARGYIKINPLAEFTYRGSSKKDLRNLTNQQLMELYTLPNLSPEMEGLRDAFLFMCWTGLHFIDYDKLKNEDIREEWVVDKKTGKTKPVTWLEKARKKTDVAFCQQMNDFAKQIIMKYDNVENMPRFTYDWMYRNLKKLGKWAVLDFPLLSKMGRKPKADTMITRLSKPLSLETASIQLGLKTTDTVSYYAKVNRQRVENEMRE